MSVTYGGKRSIPYRDEVFMLLKGCNSVLSENKQQTVTHAQRL